MTSRFNSDEYSQIEEMRKHLHKHMHDFFSCPVLWASGTQEIPSKPYATVLPTSKVFVNKDHYDEQRQYERYQVRQFEQTLSINVYGKNDTVNMYAEPLRLASEIRRWFNIHGYYKLQELDIVLIDIGTVSNRTTYVADSYDYKVGFDVTLRMTQTDSYIKYVQGDETDENYDIIETVIVTDEGNNNDITINKNIEEEQ